MPLNITVMGAGPGGYTAAVRAAQLGAKVTLMEKDTPGGTCLNRGCIPSKIMKASAEIFEKINRSKEFGIVVNGSIYPDITRIMERKQKIIEIQRKGITDLLKRHAVNYIHGTGSVSRPGITEVQLTDGTTKSIHWDKLIVATGSVSRELPELPYNGTSVISSNEALNLDKIPDSMLIIGGGVIGCEFASIFAALGTRITLVEAMPSLLPFPSIDAGCKKTLQREMKKRKITVLINHTIDSVIKTPDRYTVNILSHGKTEPVSLNVNTILVCTGRGPAESGLNYDKLGIKTDENGWIVSDEYLETTCHGIYAAGDILGPSKTMLAHVASMEGIVAAENASGEKNPMDYSVIPSVIYTMPEIACAGLSEEQASKLCIPYRSESVLFCMTGKAHAIGEINGEAKLLCNADNGVIIGVHIIGPHASDLIAEGVLAIKSKTTVKEFATTIHAHPTLSEALHEASMKFLDD